MIKINKKVCIGCGNCVSVCPKVFKMSGDKAVVKKEQESSKILCVKDAIENCPVSAIKN